MAAFPAWTTGGCSTTESEAGGPASGADAGDAALVDSPTPFTEEELRSSVIYFRTKFCPVVKNCDPVRLLRDFGSLEACIGDETRPLTEVLFRFGYGSVRTPADVRACTDALDLSSCEQYFAYVYEGSTWKDFPAACRPLGFGKLPEGSACGEGSQCESGLCKGGAVNFGTAPAGDGPSLAIAGPVPYGCGRCITGAPLGAKCTRGGCADGGLCFGGRCVKPRDVGDTCDGATTFCHEWLLCENGRCAAPPADHACDPQRGCPTVPAWFTCSVASRCEPIPLGEPGQPCGVNPPRPCVHDAACSRALGPGDGGLGELACVPKLDQGVACDEAEGIDPVCKAGVCLNGRCERIDAAQCSRPLVPR